jgi:hypothetical protein
MGFPELVPGALLVFKLYKNMWMKPKTVVSIKVHLGKSEI